MKYAGIINNDVVNGKGVCVSFWSQGCPHRCPGCHNPSTWDFDGGIEGSDEDIIAHILKLLHKNGVERNLSILGGEPLCNQNLSFTSELIRRVKSKYPNTKIFIWTGYLWEDLLYSTNVDNHILSSDDCNNLTQIITSTNILVDGRFEKGLRDITLPMRGSTNQRIIDVKKTLKSDNVVLYTEGNTI